MEDDYEKKKMRSLLLDDIVRINKVVELLLPVSNQGDIYDATIKVMGSDGEHIAEIWWDGEAETWFVDTLRDQT